MMAGVNKDVPIVLPADNKQHSNQQKTVRNILEFNDTDNTQVKSNIPSCDNEKPSTSGNSGETDDSFQAKKSDDVVGLDGELTILEPTESDDAADIEISEKNFKETGVEEISSNFVCNDDAQEGEKGSTATPNVYDIKNTINEVFWDKINSHVEDLLNTYENDPKTNNSEGVERVVSRKPEQPQISCQKLNTMTRKDPPPRSSLPKDVSNSKGRGPCHRKSMLEISSTTIDDNLISIFRREMHCTDACVIRVVDKSGIFRQSHVNRTIPMVCIDRALLQDNVSRLKPGTYLRIIRMENEGSIKIFQSSDVFAKRSVIKGGDILRTLAVYEMREKFDFEEQHTMDKETRKVMYNKFTNMQRLDRGVGSRLKWQFMERHNIEETDTIECLEDKADVSFSIFGVDGYLSYESKIYRMKHVSMIKDYAGLYYFIPQKMLSAFGSQWNRRYRSDRYFKSKIKSEEPPEAVCKPLPPDTRIRRRVKSFPQTLTDSKVVQNSPSPSVPTSIEVSGNVKSEINSPEPPSVKEIARTAFDAKKVPCPGERKANVGTGKRRQTLLAQKISDSKEILPNDGMSWRKIRDGKSVIYPNRKSSTDDSTLKRESIEITATNPEPSTARGSLPSTPKPPLKPPEMINLKTSRKNISDTFAAVPRVSAANIPTVRLLPIGQPRKRPSDSKTSPSKRAHAIRSIGILSKNQILTKGEVLLTTKDHIIFRIPRNVELPECSDTSAEDRG
ncbi:hypothetical protein ACHWQZ_G008667 [Mnemiopsis leidyi]